MGARARAVMLGVDCVDPWILGAHCLGSVIRQGKEGKEGKEGKREKLGRWGKGLLDYAFPAEPAPCRSLTPWGQLGKRRGRGQRVKAVAVGGTERVRRVLQATAELLRCTYGMECGGGHGGGFLPSFAFVNDDSLMDHIQLIRAIRMIRLWAAKEIREWWWARSFPRSFSPPPPSMSALMITAKLHPACRDFGPPRQGARGDVHSLPNPRLGNGDCYAYTHTTMDPAID